jgi:O-antigen ligase
MYGLARLIPITRWDVRWVLGGSITLGMYLAVTAFFEVAGLHSFVFPRYIIDPEQWMFFGRGRGPLMNPVGNGVLISIGMIAATIGFARSGRHVGFVYAVIGLVLMAGVYATLTRSVWIGAIAALGIISLFYTPRWARTLALMTIVLVAGLSATGFKDQVMRIKRDKELTAEAAEHSVQLRPLLAVVAWEMFKDKPIAGHGFWQYFEHHDPYHNDASYGLPLDQARPYAQHNVFLAILVDTGLIGIFLFVGFLVSLFAIAWRTAADATLPSESRNVGLLILSALAMYTVNGMFHNLMVIQMLHMFLFFMAGVAVTVYQNGLAIVATNESRHTSIAPLRPALDPV